MEYKYIYKVSKNAKNLNIEVYLNFKILKYTYEP